MIHRRTQWESGVRTVKPEGKKESRGRRTDERQIYVCLNCEKKYCDKGSCEKFGGN